MFDVINEKVNGYCPSCKTLLFENECVTKAIEFIAKHECDYCHKPFRGAIEITKYVDQ